MNEIATGLLVVVVLLAGAAGPGLAAQGGPPDHANDDGDGPPEHANAGDDEQDDDRAEDSDDERVEDPDDQRDDEDGGVLSAVEDVVDGDDDEDDATPTASRATATESDDSETPTPTREPTETPRETREETPESTPESTTAPPSQSDDANDGADDGSGDDGSSGSILGSDDDPTSTASEPSIEYGGPDDATRASVEDVRAGQTVEVPLRGPATDGEGVAVEAVDVGVESGAPFTLTVTRPTAEGGEEPAPGVPVGYFEVETDHGAVGNATLTVSVDESALPAGVAPGDLAVLRYADGEWRSTETTYDEAAGVYTAETAGFSQFALAAPGDGALQVTDVAVDESGGDGSGEDGVTTVHATVENTVDRQANGTVAITVDGETVGTRELMLGGGETATVSFDLPAEQAEGETVAVGGVESERLQVQETESETATGSIDGNLAFGVGAAAFLVLSAVGTGLLAARSDGWDWER